MELNLQLALLLGNSAESTYVIKKSSH